MAQEQNISTQLNNLLVTRNYSPEMLDRQGRPSGAEDAKTFTFDYVSRSGKNYGTMVVILDSDNDMKVFYGDNLGRAMEGDDKDEFFDFQQQINKFARMHRWTYTAKDLSQLKHTMQGLAAIQEGLFEGYYGTRKISYAGEPTEARLMIKHNRTLGETDARFRYVESLYIETADNQRFKLAFKNLSGGRAMLEHVRQGGNPYDVRGVHISEMIHEIGTLSRFNRASATRVMEGATQELITEARAYYKSLRENMKRLASPRGYQAYFETWHPATIDEQQDLVEDIKTLFIEQTLDTRIEAALPLLARIQQQGNAMKEAQIFENWVNSICEGTWALPDTPEQQDKLREILSQELIVGADATNAIEQLYDLIGDDVLFDILGDIAKDDPDADVRQAVIDRLAELGYDLGIEVGTAADDEVGADADVDSELPAEEEPELPVQEDTHALEESLRSMLKSAGMAVSEGRILDEAGETLDHILNRFKHEVKQFEAGNDLDSDLYEALFDYYSDHGEIPYGIAKGRTGDPFEWVTQRLVQDLGVNEEIDPINTEKFTDKLAGAGLAGIELGILEGSCNSTMEGEYCPEHGLMECGGMMEMGTVAGGMAPVMDEASDPQLDRYHDLIAQGMDPDQAEEEAFQNELDNDEAPSPLDPLARIKSLALRK